MIKRLYLDANTLRGRWPFNLSGGPAILTELAQRLGIEICVPSSVVVEHANSTIRHVVEHLQNAAKEIDHARPVLNGFSQLLTPSFSAEEFRKAHTAAVKHASEQYGMTIIATSSQTVEDYVAMAASVEPPFKDEDRGFRDAVHLQSVLAHMKTSPPAGEAVFVTGDGRLSGDDVVSFAKRTAGVDLAIKDLTAVIRLLKKIAPAELAALALTLSEQLKPSIVSELLPVLRESLLRFELLPGWNTSLLRVGPELTGTIEDPALAYQVGALDTKRKRYRITFQISVYVDAMLRKWLSYQRGTEQMSDFLDTRIERRLIVDVVGLVVLNEEGLLESIKYESVRLTRMMSPRTNDDDQIEWDPISLPPTVELL